MPDFVCTFPGEEWSPVISARDPEHAAANFSAQAFEFSLPPDRFLFISPPDHFPVEVRSAGDSSITWRFVVTLDESGLWVASLEKAIVRRGTPGRGSPDYRLSDEIADTILRSSDITDKFKAYFEDSRALEQKVELIKAIRSLYGCGLSDATIAAEAARGRYVDRTSPKPPEVWETCPDCEGSGEVYDGDYGQCGECGGDGKVRVDSGLAAADLIAIDPQDRPLLRFDRSAAGRVTAWIGERLLFQIDPEPIDALAEALCLRLSSTGTGESFSFNLGTGEVIES